MFVVHSDILEERKEMGFGEYDGLIGTIIPSGSDDNNSLSLRAGPRVKVPEGYTLDAGGADQELMVQISWLGRYERAPHSPRIRNFVAICIACTALLTPYILISIFSNGF